MNCRIRKPGYGFQRLRLFFFNQVQFCCTVFGLVRVGEVFGAGQFQIDPVGRGKKGYKPMNTDVSSY